MNSTNNHAYNPAEDENQGVLTKLAQGEEANNGVSQVEYMNPVRAQGPEPVKEEVNDSDTDANGVSNALLEAEDVANGDVEVDTGDETD
ncbi:hypothetical protein HNV11_03190 [Spirosoma taeanense]|uniref:Uncharacterized protein n=1 Tax=Spirosoma taeanense TaxID=2735870 RepID=A0A6M5Y4X9_9BACT|nr:hypothetical protein [Spirosoma taeanense]QJW88446.1 hypothetical protein HNV11_03190 [Spirosoma taeanense]